MIYYIIQSEEFATGTWFDLDNDNTSKDLEFILSRLIELRLYNPKCNYRIIKVTKEVLYEV